MKLLEVAVSPLPDGVEATPGLVVALPAAGTPMGVVTADGVLALKTIQLEGRRAQAAAEFLRGRPSSSGPNSDPFQIGAT